MLKDKLINAAVVRVQGQLVRYFGGDCNQVTDTIRKMTAEMKSSDTSKIAGIEAKYSVKATK